MTMETCNGCIQCCLETEMPLSEEDVMRIRKLGFVEDNFAVNMDGWLQLKNRDGRCVFNDGDVCTIYEGRPEGCRFYPVTYDDGKKRAVLDGDCPRRDEFDASGADLKALASLVARLRKERAARKNR